MDPQSPSHSQTPEGPRRSLGRFAAARALWYVNPGKMELRTDRIGPPGPGEVRVETRFSGISRGTERLVAHGGVPESEWQHMRAPFQSGTFPFPVKYGYSAAGIVTAGDEGLLGAPVFVLHPHQDLFNVPAAMVVPCGAVPLPRATLAANMETALNAHWDAGSGPADRIAVIGAGTVGLLTAYLAKGLAGADVVISDVDVSRRAIADALGLTFLPATDLTDDRSIVFHTSASAGGLATAMRCAGFEATIIELSWYGNRDVTVPLGGAFHSRRLKLISSQVGHVAPRHRSRINHRQRLEQAMTLLEDDRLDALLGEHIAFDDLPSLGETVWSATRFPLPPLIHYG